MPDWWSYGFSDFLLFSPRVYYRQFELHNQTLWPVQIIAAGLGIILSWGLSVTPDSTFPPPLTSLKFPYSSCPTPDARWWLRLRYGSQLTHQPEKVESVASLRQPPN